MKSVPGNVVVLMAGDNIHGRILVQAMVNGGCAPAVVINESSTPRAKKLSHFLQNDFFNPPSVKAAGVPVYPVDAFDSAETVAAIKSIKPSYLINGGCGIWRKPLLDAALPINVHPGLLPAYRGLDPVMWSLLYGDPVGATVHVMDEGIDTGDILLSRPLPQSDASSVLELRLCCMRWGAELLVEYLKEPGKFPRRPQKPQSGQYFKAFPEHRLDEVLRNMKRLRQASGGSPTPLGGASIQ